MLERLDESLFFFFNHTLHFSFLDGVMPYWRSMYFWLPLYVLGIFYFLLNFGKKGLIFILAVALSVGIADQVSSSIVKKTVKRVRPCNDDDLKNKVKLLVRCGSGYSFTSSHAANHFAVAVLLIFTFFKKNKRWSIAALAWAASIALGQVYVGVHYPFDVLCGAVLGAIIGFFIAFLYKKYLNSELSILTTHD